MDVQKVKLIKESVIGSGKYSDVIEADWFYTRCAAKIMRDSTLLDLSDEDHRTVKEDLLNEYKIWSGLKHPNIVQLFDLCELLSESKMPIIVMEKMDTSLRQYLEDNDKEEFHLSEKVYILRQISQGLCYLHGQNPPLIYRSLTPNNVLLNENTFLAKLTDFGMTSPDSINRMPLLTKGNNAHVFFPPEALLDPPRYSPSLDIFSFGNCIITILTHEWPHPSYPVTREQEQLIDSRSVEFDDRQNQIGLFDELERKLFISLTKECLSHYPDSRPKVSEILSRMQTIESCSDLGAVEKSPVYIQRLQDQLLHKHQENLHLEEKIKETRGHLKEERAQHSFLRTQLSEENQKSLTRRRSIHQMEIDNDDMTELEEDHPDNNTKSSLHSDIVQIKEAVDNLQEGLTKLNVVKEQETVQDNTSSISPWIKKEELRNWKEIGKQKKIVKDKVARAYRALAYNKFGLFAAADIKNSCVCIFDAEGNIIRTFLVKNVKGRLVKDMPGITFTEKGNIAISDFVGHSVLVYSSKGDFLSNINLVGQPLGLAVSPNGNIFAIEIFQDNYCYISVHNENGEFCFNFGLKGNDRGYFANPHTLLFGPDGFLYVGDCNNKRIQLFQQDGKYVRHISLSVRPLYISVSDDGSIVVAERTGKVRIYIMDNYVIRATIQFNALNFEWPISSSLLHAVTVGGNGDIYCADDNSVKIF